MDPLAETSKGQRTLLEVFTHKAKLYPTKPFALIPTGPSLESDFRYVTFGEIAKAVEATAFWLEAHFGTSKSFETLLYVGINDLRFALVFFAAQKCGYKPLFICPTNAVEHNVALLQDTACRKGCYSTELRPLVDALTTSVSDLESIEMPDWTHFLHTFEKEYPFNIPSFADSEMHPVLVVHSSGSTGRPKPVVLTNGTFATVERPIPAPPGRALGNYGVIDSLEPGARVFSAAPPLHWTGFMSMCGNNVFRDACPVLPITQDPITPKIVQGVLERLNVKFLATSPSMVEGLYRLPGGKETLGKLTYVTYVGGPLAPAVGESLRDVVHLMTGYGGTEFGAPTLLQPARSDWQYIEIHPDYADDFEPVGIDGVFELVFRDKGSLTPRSFFTYTQPVGSKHEYRTKDLFVPHPSKPGLWRFYGRKDDVLVMSTGLNMNPIPVEVAVVGCEGVSGALVVGQGRSRTALLIEPAEEVEEGRKEELLERVWVVVEKANQHLDEGGRLGKKMLVLVPPLSFVRAAKGTAVRRRTSEKFECETEKLFQTM